MVVSALTDGFPMLIDFVQDFTAFCGNKNQIFNPDAEFAGKIDARFDGEGHSFLHNCGIGKAYIAWLMILQADGVSQTVVKIFAVARLCNVIPCSFIQVAETDAGTDKAFGFFIGLSDKIVDFRIIGICFLTEKGPCHIGTVAVLAAAHIDHDAITRF